MNMPGYTAEAGLRWRAVFRGPSIRRVQSGIVIPALPTRPGCNVPQILPQLGFGGGGIGVTYPPGDDDCYCCTGWIRCPCGLSLG